MTEEAVSSAPATAAPSSGGETGAGSAQPQATGAASAQQEAAVPDTTTKQPTDWRKRESEDPDLKAYIKDAIERARASDRNKARRDKARAVVNSTDEAERARGAIEVAREVAEDQAPDEVRSAQFREKRDKALPVVDRLTSTDEYAELWKKHGKAEMDRRFFADPEEFADWVFDQVTDMRANKRAEKQAMDLARAMSAEQTADALKNLPTPIGGATTGGSGGGMTLDRLLSMPANERIQWKRSNRSEYDALVAALA